MSKTFFLQILTVAFFSIFLTGCTTRKPESVISKTQISDTKIDLINHQTPESTPTIAILKEGKTMKTIADFEPISATGAIIKTTKGDITIQLFRHQAPLTTINFLTLAKSGFYNDIVFHRVIPGFMAQVGDPLTKDISKQALWGTGGPGYAIADEFDTSLKHDKAGIVSMANSGPNTGGSQIFITYAPQPHLDGIHAVFGQVTAGMDVLESIEVGDKILTIELINK